MNISSSMAQRILAGDSVALDQLRQRPLAIAPDNLVARPWGGSKLIDFKGLHGPDWDRQGLIGESFEIAADDEDGEARQYPSQVLLEDGSRVSLPRLLSAAGPALLGAGFATRYGSRFPLLPKLLNIRELLSVQGHPAGNTEVYVVVAAEPGATIRLGFKQDVDGADMTRRLAHGRAEQQRLLALLPADMDPGLLQQRLGPALASRTMDPRALAEQLLGEAGAKGGNAVDIAHSLATLNETYWWMLDTMNELPVQPGQVIHNCNPARLVAAGSEPSAEVHALGNPAGREILALEIRRPGPTFRAWDNVRFPIREVDVPAAVAALNLRATAPEEFMVVPEPVAGRPGTFASVNCAYFSMEHLRPGNGIDVEVAEHRVHCLHGLGGAAELRNSADQALGHIAAGGSLLVPEGMGAYRLSAAAAAAEIVKVTVPG